MTVTYGFYDSLGGDRKYNADQMSRLFQGIISDGVFQSIGGNLIVSPNSGMILNVASGRAWFFNTWLDNDATIQITIPASHATLPRIDRIILEVNKDLGVRANSIKVLGGTPNASPVAPTLANTSTLKQFALADVLVGAAVVNINAGNITNKVGTAGTPFITGIVQAFDFALMLEQTRGWVEIPESWTYASANTINVPTGADTRYKKGMGVRFKQGAGYKYVYITVVADALLTVSGGLDFTVANAAITDKAITLDPETAVGFPGSFSLAAPTWDTATIDNGTGGVQPTAGSQSFLIRGDRIRYLVALGAANVLKNGAGTQLTISALSATLPSIASSPTAAALGFALVASTNRVAVVIYNSANNISIIYENSIADNSSVAFTNFQIEYRY